MSRKVVASLLVVCFCLSVCFTGCAQQADLSLKFAPGHTDTYKITTETKQSYKFAQPSLDKVKEEQTGNKVEMVITQQFQSLDIKGGSIVKITVDEIAVNIVDKTGVKFDYDSQRATDKGKPFSKLLGRSYTLNIAPDGKVEIVDAKDIRAAVTAGYDARIAKSLFSDEGIIATHEILALPDAGSPLNKGDTWTRLKGSHPKLLEPKSFEKTYTLASVKKQGGKTVATVEMNAIESAVAAPDAPKSTGMGIFAKMFDTEESFTGLMTFDVDSGRILSYNETLSATYIAADPAAAQPAEADKDEKSADPDNLTMGFLNTVSIELVK
ncbi:MAG: hypothetical protein KAS23_17425 [Anaerohalosphaera sp.]|nr:hypothetical protein [Anaerohalosphaera sp.]